MAAADVTRSATHLHEASARFGTDFDLRISQFFIGIQEGYSPERGARARSELVRSISVPEDRPLTSLDSCNNLIYLDPIAFRIPMADKYFINQVRDGSREIRRVTWTYRCLFAPLDISYLWKDMVPSLLKKYFGGDAFDTLSFTIRQRSRNNRGEPVGLTQLLYESGAAAGGEREPDAEQAFFRLKIPEVREQLPTVLGDINRNIIDRQIAERSRSGIWMLQVRNRSGSLAAQLSRSHRVNLAMTLGLDLMLLLTALLLVLAAPRMDAAARQKMQFVAGVSHALRNPLAALSVLSRNLSDGLVKDSIQVSRYGELMHKQVERLTQMVEHSLQFAGIHSRSQKARRSPVDVGRLVEAALESWRAELDSGKFAVDTSIAPDFPCIHGDPLLLGQAVGNLLGNAIKYSNGNPWIGIRAAVEDEGRLIAISVEDRGIGMDAGEWARVGEPFFRGRQAVDAQIPGAGLGLSLVRMAAEAHGGELLVESVSGLGSRFTIRLPAGEAV